MDHRFYFLLGHIHLGYSQPVPIEIVDLKKSEAAFSRVARMSSSPDAAILAGFAAYCDERFDDAPPHINNVFPNEELTFVLYAKMMYLFNRKDLAATALAELFRRVPAQASRLIQGEGIDELLPQVRQIVAHKTDDFVPGATKSLGNKIVELEALREITWPVECPPHIKSDLLAVRQALVEVPADGTILGLLRMWGNVVTAGNMIEKAQRSTQMALRQLIKNTDWDKIEKELPVDVNSYTNRYMIYGAITFVTVYLGFVAYAVVITESPIGVGGALTVLLAVVVFGGIGAVVAFFFTLITGSPDRRVAEQVQKVRAARRLFNDELNSNINSPVFSELNLRLPRPREFG